MPVRQLGEFGLDKIFLGVKIKLDKYDNGFAHYADEGKVYIHVYILEDFRNAPLYIHFFHNSYSRIFSSPFSNY